MAEQEDGEVWVTDVQEPITPTLIHDPQAL